MTDEAKDTLGHKKYDHGPLNEYLIIYATGYRRKVLAHQAIIRDQSSFFSLEPIPDPATIVFHAEIDGHWKLMLVERMSRIISIVNLTQTPE